MRARFGPDRKLPFNNVGVKIMGFRPKHNFPYISSCPEGGVDTPTILALAVVVFGWTMVVINYLIHTPVTQEIASSPQVPLTTPAAINEAVKYLLAVVAFGFGLSGRLWWGAFVHWAACGLVYLIHLSLFYLLKDPDLFSPYFLRSILNGFFVGAYYAAHGYLLLLCIRSRPGKWFRVSKAPGVVSPPE